MTIPRLFTFYLACMPGLLFAANPTQTDIPPVLFVRFVMVAQPPAVGMKIDDANSRNVQGGLIDEEAIPPQEMAISSGEKKSSLQPLNVMLNVPTAAFPLKSPAVRLLAAQTKDAAADAERKTFLNFTLPAESGVFTVFMARRAGQKSWDQPQIVIVSDSFVPQTVTAPRLINFTPWNIGILLADKKPAVAPGKVIVLTIPPVGGPSSLAEIYCQQDEQWRQVNKVFLGGESEVIPSFVCFPVRPGSTEIRVFECRQRIETLADLAERAKKMQSDAVATLK